MSDEPLNDQAMRDLITNAASDEELRFQRRDLLAYSGNIFETTGRRLELAGHIIGPDRAANASPFGYGSDEVAGVGLVLRILHQLTAGTKSLFDMELTYSACALIRQSVEIEYLAWAFDTRDMDAERWLRSDKSARETFFSPRKLRGASSGKFKGKDYGYHCEFGGHPTPSAINLLNDDKIIKEIMLVDMLGHVGRTWDHIVSWSVRFPHGLIILKYREEMLSHFQAWKREDPLAHLPEPP